MTPEEYLRRLEEEIHKDSRQEERDESVTTEESGKKKKKKRKRKNYGLRLVIFIVTIIGIFILLRSPLFYVTEIEVEGNRFYTPAQIIEMSGLQTGKNMFFEIKTRPARDRLLQTPYIRLVNVKKVPMGKLVIEITERIEHAAVPYEGAYGLIDNEGLVLSMSDKLQNLPLLEGMVINEIEPGKPLKIEQAYLLSDTLKLLKAVEATDLYFQRIYFSSVVVRAYINDSYYCEGTPAEMTANIEGIRALMQEQYKQGITKGVIRIGRDGYFSFSPKIE